MDIHEVLEHITVDTVNGIVYGVKGKPCNKKNNYGYKVYVFYKEGKVVKHFLQHHLVALAGGLEIKEGMTVNHKNGNKLDNRLENLEVISRGDNTRHAWETGANDGQYKLQKHELPQVLDLRQYGFQLQEIAEMYGVSKQTIWRRVHAK